MKTIIKLTLAAALTAVTLQAFAQDDALARLKAARAAELGGQPADTAPTPAQSPDAAATASATPAPLPAAPPIEAQAVVQVADSDTGTPTPMSTNGITLNFRNAPLSSVLAYMSDAAGFIIIQQTQVRGNVTVIDTHPMSKDEAVDVLNNVLNQLGYAAIQEGGRTLTIMTKQDAKTGNIPVKIGNVSTNIPRNDQIVTQIIPIRFVDAQQLVVDMSPFVSPQAIIIANQAGNSIVITDTQANIRHLVEIIQSIDASAEMETAVQVFYLKYANPNDVVATLAGVFPSGTGGAQTINVGGRGGRGGGGAAGGRGGGGAAGGTSAQRIQKAQQVLAVADGRTQSVVVTCAKDMMPQIKDMIDQLDVNSDTTRDTKVYTYRLDNADPNEAANVLQQMFGGTTARSSTTTSALTTRETQPLSTSSTSTTGGGARGGGGGITF